MLANIYIFVLSTGQGGVHNQWNKKRSTGSIITLWSSVIIPQAGNTSMVYEMAIFPPKYSVALEVSAKPSLECQNRQSVLVLREHSRTTGVYQRLFYLF